MNLRHALDAFRGYVTPRFRIIEHRRWWAALSGTLIVLSLGGLVVRGLNFSIDFTGGSLLQYQDRTGVSTEEVRSVLAGYGRADAEIQIVGGDQIQIRTSALTDDLSADRRTQLISDLAAQAGVDPTDVSVQVVGPTWGSQISRQALIGLVVVLVAITLYITLRFEWKMAIGAQVAMVHDVLITAGVYALTGREVSPATVIAILTILGFSLYDTVVVFDKVKENEVTLAGTRGDTYSMMVNRSLNQVLMRSLNTSFVAVLPVLSLLVVGRFGLGAVGLQDFALALFVGLLTGAYSSVFVATPIVAWLKEREPRFRALQARLAAQRAREEVAVPSGTQDAAGVGEAVAPGRPRVPPGTGGGVSPRPPRPRRQRRRKRR